MTESKNKIGIQVADARSRLSAVFVEMFQCSEDKETEWKDLETDTDMMTHLMNNHEQKKKTYIDYFYNNLTLLLRKYIKSVTILKSFEKSLI